MSSPPWRDPPRAAQSERILEHDLEVTTRRLTPYVVTAACVFDATAPPPAGGVLCPLGGGARKMSSLECGSAFVFVRDVYALLNCISSFILHWIYVFLFVYFLFSFLGLLHVFSFIDEILSLGSPVTSNQIFHYHSLNICLWLPCTTRGYSCLGMNTIKEVCSNVSSLLN